MTFRQAVEDCASVKDDYRNGLQALKRQHRSQITISDTRCLAGSIDVDTGLAGTPPHHDSRRWDYGVGYRDRSDIECVVWIEVHHACTSEVDAMLGKLQWLRNWLREEATALGQLSCPLGYIWLATDVVMITSRDRQARRLAKAGIKLPSRILSLD